MFWSIKRQEFSLFCFSPARLGKNNAQAQAMINTSAPRIKNSLLQPHSTPMSVIKGMPSDIPTVIPDMMMHTAWPRRCLSTRDIPYAVIIGQVVPAQAPLNTRPASTVSGVGASAMSMFATEKPANRMRKSVFLFHETVRDTSGTPKSADATAYADTKLPVCASEIARSRLSWGRMPAGHNSHNIAMSVTHAISTNLAKT